MNSRVIEENFSAELIKILGNVNEMLISLSAVCNDLERKTEALEARIKLLEIGNEEDV